MTASATENYGTFDTSVTILSTLRDMRDHAGWQNFHAIYRPMLLAVASRAGLAEHDAQEVVRDTIIEIANAIPTLRHDRTRGRMKNWLLTFMRRRIANFWRAKHRQDNGERNPREQLIKPKCLHVQEMAGDDFDRMWDEEWRQHAIRVAEDHVKHEVEPVQFQAFQLHVVEGVGASQAARSLGIKLIDVYWAKYRVGRLMKKTISEAASF